MQPTIKYNSKVFLAAMKYSYFNMMWIYTIVGAPSIYFGFGYSLTKSIGLFFLFSFIIWVPVLVASILLHRRSLKDGKDIEEFNSLNDSEKGRLIGEYVS